MCEEMFQEELEVGIAEVHSNTNWTGQLVGS